MGRRSRRRQRPAEHAAPPAPPSRGEERNAQARARLEPLAPGERPAALKVAVGVAAFMAAANVVAAFAVDFGGAGASTKAFAVVQSTVLAVAAWGMWSTRYWALLGFQALLALQILILALALLRVERALVGVGVAVVMAGLGAIFWSLVRLMARVQMPDRPPGPG